MWPRPCLVAGLTGVDMIVGRLSPSSCVPIFPGLGLLGNTTGISAPAALLLFVARIRVFVKLMTAAPLVVPDRTASLGICLGRLPFDPLPATLGSFGFHLLGSQPFLFFAGALGSALGATGLLLLLPSDFVFLLLLSSAALSASFVLGAAGILNWGGRGSSLSSFLLGSTGTTSRAAGFSLRIFILASPSALLVGSGKGSGAPAGIGSWVRTCFGPCLGGAALLLRGEDSTKKRREAIARFLGT